MPANFFNALWPNDYNKPVKLQMQSQTLENYFKEERSGLRANDEYYSQTRQRYSQSRQQVIARKQREQDKHQITDLLTWKRILEGWSQYLAGFLPAFRHNRLWEQTRQRVANDRSDAL